MCRVVWCDRDTRVRGKCDVHLQREKRGRPLHDPINPPFIHRFWRKVDTGEHDRCWEWQGGKNPKGYGRVKRAGSHESTHRVAYELHNGEGPGDLFVCHHCDNPPCANPSHLFLGTQSDNMVDAVEKGRVSTPDAEKYGFDSGNQPHNRQLRDGEAWLVKHLLRESDLRHARIAEMFNISRQTVADISCGRSYVNVDY